MLRTDHITHEGGKYVLRSKDRSRVLGRYATHGEAVKREGQVEAFKHMDDRKALLALRRDIVSAASKRKPRKIKRPVPPTGIILSYTKLLDSVSRAMDRIIFDELSKREIIRTDAAGDLTPGDIAKLERILAKRLGAVAARIQLIRMTDAIADRVAEYSRAEWKEVLKGSIGVDLTADPDLEPLLEKFRRRQTTLITSLSDDKIKRVSKVLRDAGSDTRVEVVTKRIMQEVGATAYRAALIARTEITTYNSQVTQARHTAAGIDMFEWSTSRDERVRPAHKALDGKRFEYSKPPFIPGEGHIVPGQIWNCRCVPIPVIPGVDDA
jgi:SPP1 gp7 family putative phage head morphogenesis protein